METSEDKHQLSMLVGAALLMATSAIGPGFLTQTAVFTEQYSFDLSLVILLTIIVTLFAQLNIWRIIVVSGKSGQDVANAAVPGLGYLISFLVFIGGIAFEMGNIAGTGMGLNVLFNIDVKTGAVISTIICITIFIVKEFEKAMDRFVQVLACIMLFLVLCVAIISRPPVREVAYRTVMPQGFDFMPFTTLIGGTVGGYITFSGAHRLLNGGLRGTKDVKKATSSATLGIVTSGILRYLLFFAVLGVVVRGIKLNPTNPAATPFLAVAGDIGYKIFGLVFWCASVTSVVGCSFTSISFIRSYSKLIDNNFSKVIIGFIMLTTLAFVIVGQPVALLVFAGAINGLILPFTLGAILIASRNKKIVGDSYHHPMWLIIGGIIVLVITTYAGIRSLGSIVALWSS
jgi:Mn2+/Fe2+ NRAMP family transporter